MALVLGRSEEAEALFDDAIEFCEASGFLPELALAHYNQAQLLHDRGGSVDTERSHDLALEGRDLSARLGMVPIATLFDELLKLSGRMTRLYSTLEEAFHRMQGENPHISEEHPIPPGQASYPTRPRWLLPAVIFMVTLALLLVAVAILRG